MDIRAKIVLDLIKSVEGAENAVIAGGAVRDLKFAVPPKDVDIFIPHKALKGVMEKVSKLDEKIVSKSEDYKSFRPKKFSESVASYARTTRAYKGNPFECFGFTHDEVVYDLITSTHPNDEEFGKNVIEDFDYGLNMVYYDGISIDEANEEFQKDFGRRSMTLRRLSSLSDLPKMIMRYNNIAERYKKAQSWAPHFDATAITLKKAKVVKPRGLAGKTAEVLVDEIVGLDIVEPMAEPVRVRRDQPGDWINEARNFVAQGGQRRGAEIDLREWAQRVENAVEDIPMPEIDDNF